MPGVHDSFDRYAYNMWAEMQRQGRALGTQQQNVITNLHGQPVVVFGMVPGSNPPEYGMQLVNQSFTSPLAFFGEDASGAVSQKFYAADGTTVLFQTDSTGQSSFDPSGNLVTKLDATGLHIYNSSGVELIRLGVQADGTVSVKQFDPSGNARSVMGELANGDYGLATYDHANNGVYHEVNPVVAVYDSTNSPVNSTSYISIGPGLTATIGASGSALVRASANIYNDVSNMTGSVLVYIDDGSSGSCCYIWNENPGTQVGTSGANSQVVTGLSAGTHTFSMYAQSSLATGTTNISDKSITVQPL